MREIEKTKEWKEYEKYFPYRMEQTAMERLADFISFVNSSDEKRAGEIIEELLTNK